MSKILKIITLDKKTINIPETLFDKIKNLKIINDILGWDENYNLPEEGIPLEVNEQIFKLIITYLSFTPSEEINQEEFNKDFLNMDDDTLFKLVNACNYLEFKELLDLLCKHIATIIKSCSSPTSLRKRFNITNDFTPEEEEQIKKEYNIDDY